MPLAEPRKGISVGFHIYPNVSDEGTLGEPETIIWSSIRHLCSRNVAEWVVGPAHGVTGKKDRATVARSLKLYIQQASEFYETAKAAKPNTAPLIYYYSFLNLAKALCELHQPRFHERPECYRHGVSWRADPKRVADPAKESVSISRRGIWHVLWESITRSSCPVANPTKLAIRDLFSYCPEISSEFSRASGGVLNLIELENPDILYDEPSSEGWLRFSVERFWLRHFRLSVGALTMQMQTSRSGYTEVRSPDQKFRTLQSTIPRKLGSRETGLSGLRNDILGLNVFTHLGRNGKLMYYFPVQTRLPVRMPQLLVSYTILFWLGSLVRYDPHSVSAMMDSEYWMLVDGFMSQSRLWLLELFEWEFYQAETTLWVAR